MLDMQIEELYRYHLVSQFIYKELELLDRREWDDWQALFSEDGVYWAPATPEQENPTQNISLIYDEQLLMKVRIARFKTSYAFSLQPFPRSSHLVSNIVLLPHENENELRVKARFLMTEYRKNAPVFYAGFYEYLLSEEVTADFSIKQKRAELINCDGSLPSSSIYF